MGIHICLRKLDGSDHPEWDSLRHAGDREVLTIIDRAAGLINNRPPDYNPWIHKELMFRPADPEKLADATWPDVNPERWRLLTRILREEPDYWIDWGF
ncbi:MAG TPA: hypothetical protein VGW34_07970 [Allosphingosinicella sp.]|nr:hypothetical protein [Allosphingosinicella sp.]